MYIGWAWTIPGTVLWRALDWRVPRGDPERVVPVGRPFLEDLTLGSVLGLITSVPAYLACVAIGAPRLVLLWPLLVLVPAALTPRGRLLLRRRQAHPTPVWFSWALAAVTLYVVVYSVSSCGRPTRSRATPCNTPTSTSPSTSRWSVSSGTTSRARSRSWMGPRSATTGWSTR